MMMNLRDSGRVCSAGGGWRSSCFSRVQNGHAVGQVPVVLDAVVLEHLPGKALIWAHFELDLAKGARLHQALPHEEALVFRLFVDFI